MKHPVLSDEDNARLYGHSQQDNKPSIITLTLGQGPQTRNKTQLLLYTDKGHMRQQGVVDCDRCEKHRLDKLLRNGPYGWWREGDTVKEKHWDHGGTKPNSAVGLKIRCFYSAYLNLLESGRDAYEQYSDIYESSLALHSRAALVRAEWKDVITISNDQPSNLGMGYFPTVVMMATKIKVLDLIDLLPLIPSLGAIETILDAPADWHTKWHELLDTKPINSWRDFPARIVATLQAAGLTTILTMDQLYGADGDNRKNLQRDIERHGTLQRVRESLYLSWQGAIDNTEDWKASNFSYTDLSEVDLSQSALKGMYEEALLTKNVHFPPRSEFLEAIRWLVAGSGIELTEYLANMLSCDFTGANLSRANLRGSNLQHAILVDSNLSSVDLRDANLSYADLERAELDGADLTGAKLGYTHLFDVNLENVIGLTPEQIEAAFTNERTRLPDYLRSAHVCSEEHDG